MLSYVSVEVISSLECLLALLHALEQHGDSYLSAIEIVTEDQRRVVSDH